MGITSLEHRCKAIIETPEVYRPPCCPHCGLKVLWRHGYYYRKADRRPDGETSLNPVPIGRYCCSGVGGRLAVHLAAAKGGMSDGVFTARCPRRRI